MKQHKVPNKSKYVSKLFGDIAQRYDLLNHLMSFGQHQTWRRQAVKMVDQNLSITGPVLDVATGTCDFAIDIESGLRLFSTIILNLVLIGTICDSA